MRAKYIGCIRTRAHGGHMTSLLCHSDVTITVFRNFWVPFLLVSNGEQEKESIIRVRVG